MKLNMILTTLIMGLSPAVVHADPAVQIKNPYINPSAEDNQIPDSSVAAIRSAYIASIKSFMDLVTTHCFDESYGTENKNKEAIKNLIITTIKASDTILVPGSDNNKIQHDQREAVIPGADFFNSSDPNHEFSVIVSFSGDRKFIQEVIFFHNGTGVNDCH